MRRAASLLLLLAMPAFAGNGISGITVVKTRNLSSVALTAIVSGDDDTSAVLRIFQQWNDGSGLDSGMVMHRRAGSTIHEGRILWLTPGRTVRFYIEGTDAGGSFNTLPDTVSCAAVRQMVATGTVIYVSKSGSDANPGTLASPDLTIAGGLADLKASPDSGAFGGVIVAPGEYHERVDLDFAGDGKPRFLMGDGTNRDSTIICGANEFGEAGKRDNAGNNLAWVVRPDPNNAAGEPDSTYYTLLPAAAGAYGDSVQLVVVGWGEQLHRKTSLAALFADSTFTGDPASTNQGELSGWYWAGDTMYVKRRSGTSPTGSTIHFGYRDNMIFVKRRGWRVANLTIRYAGGVTDQTGSNPALWMNRADPGENGRAVTAAINGSSAVNASGLTLDSLRIYGCNQRAFDLNFGANGSRCDSVTITNCLLDGLTVGAMGYGAGKGRAEEDGMEIKVIGAASSICNNFVTGTFNGIGFETAATDSNTARGCEISGNLITNCSDDAIELDNSHGYNTLVMNNSMDRVADGVSLAPIFDGGPIYILYNTISNYIFRAFKVGGGTVGSVKIYQNTAASLSRAENRGCQAIYCPGGSIDGLEFRNNILSGVGNNTNHTGVINGTTGGGTFSTTTNSFNYDVLDSVVVSPDLGSLAYINSSPYSLISLRSSFSWETNGTAGNAYLEDVTGGHHNPKKQSPAIGRGMSLPGINTAMGRKLYNKFPRAGSQAPIYFYE